MKNTWEKIHSGSSGISKQTPEDLRAGINKTMVQMDTVSTNNILGIPRSKLDTQGLILVISFLQPCHPVPSINLANSAVKSDFLNPGKSNHSTPMSDLPLEPTEAEVHKKLVKWKKTVRYIFPWTYTLRASLSGAPVPIAVLSWKISNCSQVHRCSKSAQLCLHFFLQKIFILPSYAYPHAQTVMTSS